MEWDEWKELLADNEIRTIELYLKYHIKGKLDKIYLHIIPSMAEVYIYLTIDQKEHLICLEEYQWALEEEDRDGHRECYFGEELWCDYFAQEDNVLETEMEELCDIIQKHFGGVNVQLELDYDSENEAMEKLIQTGVLKRYDEAKMQTLPDGGEKIPVLIPETLPYSICDVKYTEKGTEMKCYYIVKFILESQVYYTLWHTGKKNGFEINNDKLRIFPNFQLIKDYLKRQHLDLDDEMTEIDCDELMSADLQNIEYKEICIFWDNVIDVAGSLNTVFMADKQENEIYNKTYLKLYSRGARQIKDGEIVYCKEKLNKKELKMLEQVIKRGTDLLKKVLVLEE